MSIRYMIKAFVQDLWVNWRRIEGYPVEPSYFEVYLAGRPHGENYQPGAAGPTDKYPGKIYDPVAGETSETEKLTAMRMHDLNAISDEEAEKVVGVPANEFENLNYHKVADFYNRKGQHQKFQKEMLNNYLDRTIGKVPSDSKKE
jgi:hypothetical protein